MHFPRHRRLLRRRFYRRPLLPFLLAATLALDLMIAMLPVDLFQGEATITTLATGLIVGQIGLLALWVVSYRTAWRSRLCLTLLLLAALAGILQRTVQTTLDIALSYSVVAFAGALITCGAVHWFLAWRHGLRSIPRHWRFNIASMIAATTLIALIAVIIRYGNWTIMSDNGVLILVAIESFLPAIVYLLVVATRSIAKGLLILLALVAIGAFGLAVAPQYDTFLSWAQLLWVFYFHCVCVAGMIATWLLCLSVRRVASKPFSLGLINTPPSHTPPEEREKLADSIVDEAKELNVVV